MTCVNVSIIGNYLQDVKETRFPRNFEKGIIGSKTFNSCSFIPCGNIDMLTKYP